LRNFRFCEKKKRLAHICAVSGPQDITGSGARPRQALTESFSF
jgi:hypothetical protein